MANKYTTLAIFLVVAFGSFAQDFDEKQLKKGADALYEKGKFHEAEKQYSRLLSQDRDNFEYNFKYGVCLLNKKHLESATSHLKYVAKQSNPPAESHYFLGQAYQLRYEFDLAIKEYQRFNASAKTSMRNAYDADLKINQCKNGKKQLNSYVELIVRDKNLASKKDFFRLYDLSQIGGKILVTAEYQSKVDKQKRHTPIIHFPTATDYIFYSSYGNDTKNGLDIYMKRRLDVGKWSDAVKLPSSVNTKYNEDYAYMHPDGKTLYFSSMGHNSIGGYDVFKVSFDQNTQVFGVPERLSFKINSPDDDILYIVDSINQNAYFSTSRRSDYEKVHVYRTKLKTYPSKDQLLALDFTLVNQSNNINQVRVLNKTTGQQLNNVTFAKSGNVVGFNVPGGANYEVVLKDVENNIIKVADINVPASSTFSSIHKMLEPNASGVLDHREKSGDHSARDQELAADFFRKIQEPSLKSEADLGIASNSSGSQANENETKNLKTQLRSLIQQAEDRKETNNKKKALLFSYLDDKINEVKSIDQKIQSAENDPNSSEEDKQNLKKESKELNYDIESLKKHVTYYAKTNDRLTQTIEKAYKYSDQEKLNSLETANWLQKNNVYVHSNYDLKRLEGIKNDKQHDLVEQKDYLQKRIAFYSSNNKDQSPEKVSLLKTELADVDKEIAKVDSDLSSIAFAEAYIEDNDYSNLSSDDSERISNYANKDETYINDKLASLNIIPVSSSIDIDHKTANNTENNSTQFVPISRSDFELINESLTQLKTRYAKHVNKEEFERLDELYEVREKLELKKKMKRSDAIKLKKTNAEISKRQAILLNQANNMLASKELENEIKIDLKISEITGHDQINNPKLDDKFSFVMAENKEIKKLTTELASADPLRHTKIKSEILVKRLAVVDEQNEIVNYLSKTPAEDIMKESVAASDNQNLELSQSNKLYNNANSTETNNADFAHFNDNDISSIERKKFKQISTELQRYKTDPWIRRNIWRLNVLEDNLLEARNNNAGMRTLDSMYSAKLKLENKIYQYSYNKLADQNREMNSILKNVAKNESSGRLPYEPNSTLTASQRQEQAKKVEEQLKKASKSFKKALQADNIILKHQHLISSIDEQLESRSSLMEMNIDNESISNSSGNEDILAGYSQDELAEMKKRYTEEKQFLEMQAEQTLAQGKLSDADRENVDANRTLAAEKQATINMIDKRLQENLVVSNTSENESQVITYKQNDTPTTNSNESNTVNVSSNTNLSLEVDNSVDNSIASTDDITSIPNGNNEELQGNNLINTDTQTTEASAENSANQTNQENAINTINTEGTSEVGIESSTNTNNESSSNVENTSTTEETNNTSNSSETTDNSTNENSTNSTNVLAASTTSTTLSDLVEPAPLSELPNVPSNYKEGLFFTVQIGAFSNKVEYSNFPGAENIFYRMHPNGLVLYNSGKFMSMEDALNKSENMKETIPDAFTTCFFNGKRISLAQGKGLLEQHGDTILEQP